ncbi:MAG: hypothetical protein ACKV1O_01130 [Saprospiraceae bacterium]
MTSEIIVRYSKELGVSISTSKKHNKVLVEFLDLASKSEHSCYPDKTIDNAWHNFILFTKDYYAFCQRKYNKLIHHNPIDKINEPQIGYLCKYSSKGKSKMIAQLTTITQAICDGGGDSCSTCSSDGT